MSDMPSVTRNELLSGQAILNLSWPVPDIGFAGGWKRAGKGQINQMRDGPRRRTSTMHAAYASTALETLLSWTSTSLSFSMSPL